MGFGTLLDVRDVRPRLHWILVGICSDMFVAPILCLQSSGLSYLNY